MKIRVIVKDCNLRDSIKNAILEQGINEDNYNYICNKYVKYGEYITVEFDLSDKEPPKLI